MEACKGDGSASSPLAFGPILSELFETADDMVIKHLATGRGGAPLLNPISPCCAFRPGALQTRHLL